MGNRTTHTTDVCIIGAGAAGLAAAIAAAREGASVLVIEHTSVSAKKLLSTGNGRCNFSNTVQMPACYRSDDPVRIAHFLERFSAEDAIRFFRELGVYPKEKSGYLYPRSNQASSIRDALIAETRRLCVRFLFKTDVLSIQKQEEHFVINTSSGHVYASRCILATGGAAAAKTGSDGSGFALAKSLGHRINKPLPALVPLVGEDTFFKTIAGVRADATITLFCDGKNVASDTGEIQFTDYGLSGIPVFQVSRFAAVALDRQQEVMACLDLVPEISGEDLFIALKNAVDRFGGVKSIQQLLSGFCNQKLAQLLCVRAGYDPTERVKTVDDALLSSFVNALKDFRVSVVATKDFSQAQTTCGGVLLAEVDDALASRLVPRLYFAGEILDVDGMCGGYNLHWAWLSGIVAGRAAASFAAGEDCAFAKPSSGN